MKENSAAILAYHRVASSTIDLNLLNVSPQNFSAHMAELKSQRTILPLEELIQQVKKGEINTGAVAITFDDGYLDFINNALPILQQFKIPATLFITTGAATRTGYTFWWDRLEEMLKSCSTNKIFEIIGSEFNDQFLLDAVLRFQRLCLDMPVPAIDEFLRISMNTDNTLEHPTLTIPELAEAIFNAPEITIGSHSVSHSQMSILHPIFQKIELAESKRIIEKVFKGRNSNFFALPYGHPGSWNESTIKIAKSLGYKGILTTQQKLINNNDIKLYTIPRLLVRDWSASEFRSWLKENYTHRLLDISLENRRLYFQKHFNINFTK